MFTIEKVSDEKDHFFFQIDPYFDPGYIFMKRNILSIR